MSENNITCPRCGMTSWNPNDIREGYCGNCHDWTTTVHKTRRGTLLARIKHSRTSTGDWLFEANMSDGKGLYRIAQSTDGWAVRDAHSYELLATPTPSFTSALENLADMLGVSG